MNVLLDRFSAGPASAAGEPITLFTYTSLVEARADESNRTAGDIANIPTGDCVCVLSGTTPVWVPQYVADNGTPVVYNTLKGDVTPASETVPWSENLVGTGTATSDGTHVTLDTPLAADKSTISTSLAAPASGITWFDGMVQWTIGTEPSRAEGWLVLINDGSRACIFSMDGTTSPYGYGCFDGTFDTTPMPQSGYLTSGGPSLLVEHRLTIIIDSNALSAWVYVDGACTAMGRHNLFPATAGLSFVMGDSATVGAITLKLRDVATGTA
jgi:hypothetical protein